MDPAALPDEPGSEAVPGGSAGLATGEEAPPSAPDAARGPRLRDARRLPRSVRVTWDDGAVGAFHHLWLRDNCGCPECWHPQTLERTFDPLSVPGDVSAASVALTHRGELCVEWRPRGHVSLYDPGWLRACRDGAAGGSPRDPAPVTWDASLSDAMPILDYDAIAGSERDRLRWLRLLRDLGVAILRGTPCEPLSVLALARLVGNVRATNFGDHFDVVSKPDPNSNAYTALGLPSHTDLPNWERPPGYQFLHCLENGAEGGESILVDGFRAAEELRRREPTVFRLLCRSPIGFRFRDGDSDIRHRAPTIALDESGAVGEVRFNLAVMEAIDAPADRMGKLCRALRAFAAAVRDPALECRYRLDRGELLVFDNRRVLHGRAPFDPTAGRRHLQGCYVDRDQLLSRIRVLERSPPQ